MDDQEIYDMCIEMAEKSPCQKRGFGSIAKLSDGAMFSAYNQPIHPAKHLCEGKCIRFDIASGADSLIGACGHSEELAIWGAISAGYKVRDSVLYVAGVSKPDNIPLVKADPHFYCTRCATLMHYAAVAGVNVWLHNKWHYLPTYAAYQTSLDYSLKKITLEKGQS